MADMAASGVSKKFTIIPKKYTIVKKLRSPAPPSMGTMASVRKLPAPTRAATVPMLMQATMKNSTEKLIRLKCSRRPIRKPGRNSATGATRKPHSMFPPCHWAVNRYSMSPISTKSTFLSLERMGPSAFNCSMKQVLPSISRSGRISRAMMKAMMKGSGRKIQFLTK